MNSLRVGLWSFVLLIVLGTCGWIQAQTNSWNSNTGGNWDDAASWSLGIPPASGQSIMFTNAYWKAVVIDASTVSSAPQTLAVKSLTITSISPANGVYTTRNTLLLNYAGAGNPLVIGVNASNPGSFLIDSNSTVAMFSSGLIVNNALSDTNSFLGNFQVDGNFIQSDNSEVVAGFLDLNGTYNMTNGEMFAGTQFINGMFNQVGGTNSGRVVLGTNGNYQLFEGAFNGDIILDPGFFVQRGGTVSARLTFDQPYPSGTYQLMGGLLLAGDIDLGAAPVTNNDVLPGGIIEQSGGTNMATSLAMGFGDYYLSNGVLDASSMLIVTNYWAGGLFAGDLDQYGGYATNGELTMIGGRSVGFHDQEIIAPAKYNLYGGMFEAASITMNFGNLLVGSVGLNATNRVGSLSMDASSVYATGNGAFVEVNKIGLTNGSLFWDRGGTLSGARNVFLANGIWDESVPGRQLGQLHLLSGTNSTVSLPSSGTFQFADSSVVPWGSGGTLTIARWSGSFTGGGAQQILFGTDASGLTAQQLSHVHFLNPAGLPNGTYGAKILSTGEVIPDGSSSSSGPVNLWINPASGSWDDASSWSLGVLPNSSQSVLIANTNWKAVAINPATPVNFPGSMTVSNLFIDGATNTVNTLLLNNFGTTTPLTVVNGLVLQNGGQLLNFNSGLIVQNGGVMITNSDLIQDGGFIRTTNVQMYISGSEVDITNGVFEAGTISLGYPVSSRYNQYGGSVKIASFITDSYIFGTNVNSVSLYGGTLNLPNGMSLYGEAGGISYFQSGGTNFCGQIFLGADLGQGGPSFTLNGGLLADNGLSAMPGDIGSITINQNGGTHVITNSLSLEGENHLGESVVPATYNLNGGTLSAGSVNLNADSGTAAFNQTNGIAYVGEFEGVSNPHESYWGPTLTLSGGTLACSNLDMLDSATIGQSGGALIVSNTLTIAGFIQPGPKIYSVYSLAAGSLSASNINIGGNWIIGDSAGPITNAGTCTLSNSISIGNAAEQLGQFILAGTSTIDLFGGTSHLSFANSSAQAWASGAALIVSDWNGETSGGGAEQLKFGTDQSGLTAAQLNQVRFRISTNLYSAKILNTGEIVPDQKVAASLAFVQRGNQLILNWLLGYKLQTATVPAGPFQDVFMPFTTPPYTNSMDHPQQFFRIVPQ